MALDLQTIEHAAAVFAAAVFIGALWYVRGALKDYGLFLLGEFLAIPSVADWLIRRAMRTPYSHLPSNDDPSYMQRWWLFNPYERVALRDSTPEAEQQSYMAQFPWLPWSFRVHRIIREDRDPHMHDHPWNARTFILKGWYIEERLVAQSPYADKDSYLAIGLTKTKVMAPGCTQAIRFNQYHRINEVSRGGVWTLFVTSRYQGTWGFLVNGVKVPYREYFKKNPGRGQS